MKKSFVKCILDGHLSCRPNDLANGFFLQPKESFCQLLC